MGSIIDGCSDLKPIVLYRNPYAKTALAAKYGDFFLILKTASLYDGSMKKPSSVLLAPIIDQRQLRIGAIKGGDGLTWCLQRVVV